MFLSAIPGASRMGFTEPWGFVKNLRVFTDRILQNRPTSRAAHSCDLTY